VDSIYLSIFLNLNNFFCISKRFRTDGKNSLGSDYRLRYILAADELSAEAALSTIHIIKFDLS